MVRKATPSKSAAKKAGARKHARQGWRSRLFAFCQGCGAQGATGQVQVKRVVKVASAKADQAKKAPVKKAPVAAKAAAARR